MIFKSAADFGILPAPQARDSDLTGPVHVSCIGSAIFQKSACACAHPRARKSRKNERPQNGPKVLKFNAARKTEQFEVLREVYK